MPTEAELFPTCGWAGRFRERVPDRFCDHPEVGCGVVVTAAECHVCPHKGGERLLGPPARVRPTGARKPRPRRPACQHVGEALEFIPCACPAIGQFPILACAIHGECVTKLAYRARIPPDHDASGCSCCQKCDDYRASETPLPQTGAESNPSELEKQ